MSCSFNQVFFAGGSHNISLIIGRTYFYNGRACANQCYWPPLRSAFLYAFTRHNINTWYNASMD